MKWNLGFENFLYVHSISIFFFILNKISKKKDSTSGRKVSCNCKNYIISAVTTLNGIVENAIIGVIL